MLNLPLRTIFEKQIIKPVSDIKYIFLTDNEFYAENTFSKLSLSLYFAKMPEQNSYSIEEFEDFIIDCIGKGICYAGQYYFIPICSATRNKELQKILKKYNYSYSLEAWKTFCNRNKDADYYQQHVDEFEKLVSDYIIKCDDTSKEPEPTAGEFLFFDEKGRFLHSLFGDYIIEKYHIRYLKDRLHIYDDGVYIDNDSLIEHSLLREICTLTSRQRTEVIKYMKSKLYSRDTVLEPKPTLIALKSGLFDIATMETVPYDPSIVIFNKIDYDFNLNADSKTISNFLNLFSNNDEQILLLINEVISYMLYRATSFDSIFILVSKGGNGKSTLLNMITQLIGSRNVCNLTMHELSDRFKTCMIQEKLVNIGDDIPSTYVLDDSIIKKMATGEAITVERKGQDPYIIKPTAKHIFSANKIPKIKGASYGTERRLVVIPCDYTFSTSSNVDKDFRNKVSASEDMEYLLIFAITGLKSLLRNNGFTKPEAVIRATEEYNKSNNPINEFLEEEGYSFFALHVRDAYELYKNWCFNSGYVAMNKGNFKAELKNMDIEDKLFRAKDKVVRRYHSKFPYTIISNDESGIPEEFIN